MDGKGRKRRRVVLREMGRTQTDEGRHAGRQVMAARSGNVGISCLKALARWATLHIVVVDGGGAWNEARRKGGGQACDG